ncbi:MAG: PorV/PorQ family protein [Rhodothermaceae bacterium]|nr:PorV/PorQ family protein [Rhodothermaceae bacterium]
MSLSVNGSMKRWMYILLFLTLFTTVSVSAQQKKLAQTAMKFLSVSVSPRAAGLGDALTAIEHGSASLFYNPSGMAWQESNLDIVVGQTQWIAEINYSMGSISFRPGSGRLGVIGLSFLMVDYGDLEETIRFDNDQGFLDVGTFSPSAWSFGIGYARKLSDRFSVGAQFKWANQYLANSVMGIDDGGDYVRENVEEGVFAYDFGVLYKTGFRSLNFAVSARNFAPEITFSEESVTLPLTLNIGVSMNMMDLMDRGSRMHQLLLSIDASNPRDFPEQIKVGTEYVFLNTFILRAGYAFPTDEQGFSVGLGLKQSLRRFGFGADYSFTDFGVLSNVQRLAIRFSL